MVSTSTINPHRCCLFYSCPPTHTYLAPSLSVSPSLSLSVYLQSFHSLSLSSLPRRLWYASPLDSDQCVVLHHLFSLAAILIFYDDSSYIAVPLLLPRSRHLSSTLHFCYPLVHTLPTPLYHCTTPTPFPSLLTAVLALTSLLPPFHHRSQAAIPFIVFCASLFTCCAPFSASFCFTPLFCIVRLWLSTPLHISRITRLFFSRYVTLIR